MATHQLIEAQEYQDCPNQGAAQIPCEGTRSSLAMSAGERLLLQPEERTGMYAAKFNTSFEAAPVPAGRVIH